MKTAAVTYLYGHYCKLRQERIVFSDFSKESHQVQHETLSDTA